MMKRTPQQALRYLREQVEDEIVKARAEPDHYDNDFTIVLMNQETLERLKGADRQSYYFMGVNRKMSGYYVKSFLTCMVFTAFVAIDNSLSNGKVVIRRVHAAKEGVDEDH